MDASFLCGHGCPAKDLGEKIAVSQPRDPFCGYQRDLFQDLVTGLDLHGADGLALTDGGGNSLLQLDPGRDSAFLRFFNE